MAKKSSFDNKMKFSFWVKFKRLLVPINRISYDKIPEIKMTKDARDYSCILLPDVSVGVNNGDGYLNYFCHISKKSLDSLNEFYFETPRTGCKRVNGKSVIGLLGLSLFRDSLVDIRVEGPYHSQIRKEAIQMYAGVTTRGYKPDFTRLDDKIKRV